MELGVALLDVAGPFVGDVGLELGGLAGTWAVRDHDACAEGEVVWILILVDGRDEVRERVFVNVREVIVIVCVHAIDAGWVGV